MKKEYEQIHTSLTTLIDDINETLRLLDFRTQKMLHACEDLLELARKIEGHLDEASE